MPTLEFNPVLPFPALGHLAVMRYYQVVFIEHLLYARNFVLISFDPHTRLWIRNHRCHLEMMKMRLRELE